MNIKGLRVRLINAFEAPLDTSVAAARTCYSSKVILPADVSKDEPSKKKRNEIAKSTYLAGHHTTLQHPMFQFTIEGVSRLAIWSFLHSHPYYNSEQVSQRYVHLNAESAYLPPALSAHQQQIYQSTIFLLFDAYEKLCLLLTPSISEEYLRIFPGRHGKDGKWSSVIQKKAQEVARYLLPLASFAHLYHTISGITLLRYLRIAGSFDASNEQVALVRAMCDEVSKHDPDFFRYSEDSIPLNETPEYSFFDSSDNLESHERIKRFDAKLEGHLSLLVDHTASSESVMAEAIRSILGVDSLSDEAAVDLVMDPAKNRYLAETMNLTHHSKLSRAMVHPYFTFMKKLSHCADSQNQRHRTIPGSRPVLANYLTSTPDYVVPAAIAKSTVAFEFYRETMEGLWLQIDKFIEAGGSKDLACYLLPNAFPVRFFESGSLLDFHHKWTHRLCYTAQEEIWQASREEVVQVEHIFPRIGQYLRPPCHIRKAAGRTPLCPEGSRFCGVRVWDLKLSDMNRTI